MPKRKKIDPDYYPRKNFQRDNWMSLNGEWSSTNNPPSLERNMNT